MPSPSVSCAWHAERPQFVSLEAHPNSVCVATAAHPCYAGTLAPVVDCEFPLDALNDAHAHMESNASTGKILIRVAAEPQ